MRPIIKKLTFLWKGTTNWDIKISSCVNVDRILSRLSFVEVSYYFSMSVVILSQYFSYLVRLFFKYLNVFILMRGYTLLISSCASKKKIG